LRNTEQYTGATLRLLGEARPLFIAGCQRSGTTAFAEYLNQHPKILVGVERYRGVPAKKIGPEFFTFERLLDYREQTIRPRGYYLELLLRKNQEKLEWIGDKNPNYLLHFDVLSRNNPGARFIVLYRPVEEVAESWEIASNNPNDPWRGRENGFERGVEIWNRALRKTREFVEDGTDPKVLIISYHDFFYRNEACVSLVSRFLDLEFDETIRRKWKETSARFERERRSKRPLTDRQVEFVKQHKDNAAEKWILGQINEQWKSLERDAEKTEEIVRSQGGEAYRLAAAAVKARAAAEVEAKRVRRLERRVVELEDNLAKETRTAERLEKQNEYLTHQVRDLRKQIHGIHSSKSWTLLERLNRLRTMFFAWTRRTP
jgi:hypothetical protein